MKLIFASQNLNKTQEIAKLLPPDYEIVNLLDLGFEEEIEETATTIEGNSLLKAKFVFEKFGLPCFADDTGLEVEALNGAPGVYSARYAGIPKDDQKNIEKLLSELNAESNRQAKFKTIFTLYTSDEWFQFEGIIKGEITKSPFGNEGFGYDPVFTPVGKEKTFAQMSAQEKNAISHRAIALNKMINHIKTLKIKK